jgi:PKD repeat protein
VDFVGSPTSGLVPLQVSFTNLSAGSPDGWHWHFGDGETSTVRNPVHTYVAAGSYTVKLAVTYGQETFDVVRENYIAVSRFVDVPLDHWAFEEIEACVSTGLIDGDADHTYRPDGEVSRAEIAVFLARGIAEGDANVPDPAPGDDPGFSDVSPSHWAYRHIVYCSANEVVLGYGDGHYGPADLVNRGQMAAFTARAMVAPLGEQGIPPRDPSEQPTFGDVTPENEWSWCWKHVEYLVDHGVVSSNDENLYRPGELCDRAQTAVYLAKGFDLVN